MHNSNNHLIDEMVRKATHRGHKYTRPKGETVPLPYSQHPPELPPRVQRKASAHHMSQLREDASQFHYGSLHIVERLCAAAVVDILRRAGCQLLLCI